MNLRNGRMNEQERRACKICGSGSKYAFSMDNKHGEPLVLDIFLCGSCGLLFVGNRITDDQTAHAYETFPFDGYYDQVATNTEAKVSRAMDDLAGLIAEDSDHASVLDVGCGYGHFLERIVQRYPKIRLAGHELPGDSASTCQSKGFKVFTCPLAAIPDRFSSVVLLDVAEHVPQPLHTFSACRSLLEDRGYLYIHTPRRCFWDSLFLACVRLPVLGKLARSWFRSRVSIFHLHLWTDQALRLALNKAGFDLVYMRTEMELTWPLEWYVRVILGADRKITPLLTGAVTRIANLLLVKLGTLKNKNVCLAKKA